MSKIEAPSRSLEQRLTALAQANVVRVFRATLKQEIKAGRADPIRVLLSPPEHTHTMKVYDLLMAMPRVGRVKAGKALNRARVSPSKTLAGLTDRQRREIAEFLSGPSR